MTVIAGAIAHCTTQAERLFPNALKVHYVCGELRLSLNGRIPSQNLHHVNTCADKTRSADLALIVPLSRHRRDYFVELQKDSIPISWTCPSVDVGDIIAFNANIAGYYSGSPSGLDADGLLVVPSLMLHFKVIPVDAIVPPGMCQPDTTVDERVFFDIHQPPVSRCVCCEHPITNRGSVQVCRRCFQDPPGDVPDLKHFGDLCYIICDKCTGVPVDTIATQALDVAKASDPSNSLLKFLCDSCVKEPTAGHTWCKHAITEREAIDPACSVLLYFSVQELLQSAAWVMRVLLTNVLVSHTLIDSCKDLQSLAIFAGDGCQRASALARLMLRAIGIRMFSSPQFGRASLLQAELGPAYKSLTLTRLSDISELVIGLRLPSPEVATLSAEFIGMVGTATIEGALCVTRCVHEQGKSRAGFVQCWPTKINVQKPLPQDGDLISRDQVDAFIEDFNSKLPTSIRRLYESLS